MAANSTVSGDIPPKFKLNQAFMVVLVTCKNEEDPIKNEGTRVLTRFSPLQVYGIFFRRSRAANSAVLGRIWMKFELLRDIIDVLIICKYEEDPIKNEGARVLTRLYEVFFRNSRATNSEVSRRILPKFKLIQAFRVVLVTCTNEEDPIKNEGARVQTRFSPC